MIILLLLGTVLLSLEQGIQNPLPPPGLFPDFDDTAFEVNAINEEAEPQILKCSLLLQDESYGADISCAKGSPGIPLPIVFSILRRNYQIKKLVAHGLGIFQLPDNLGNFLPNINDIVLKNTEKTDTPHSLSPSIMVKFKHLKRLTLQGFGIRKIFSEAFDGFRSLTHLTLSGNEISFFGFESYKYLTELEHLDLANNSLRDNCIKSVERFPKLKYLDLSRNFLKRFEPSKDSAFLASIRYIKIVDTPLESLKLETLNEAYNLQSLEFSFINNPEDLFLGNLRLRKLEKLVMHGGTAKYFDPSILRHVAPEINHFGIVDSELVEVPHRTKGTRESFHYLNLRGNRLTSVSAYSLLHYNYLKVLDLSFNRIESVNEDTFRFMNHLSCLDLSGNVLRDLPHNLLHHNRYLRSLLVAQNELTSIQSDPRFWEYDEFLEVIDLSWNRIVDLYLPAHGKGNVSQFIVKDNPLSRIVVNATRREDALSILTSYRHQIPEPTRKAANLLDLDPLSHNSTITSLAAKKIQTIRDVDKYPYFVEKTNSLDLSFNEISFIFRRDFLQLYELEFLCLRNNKIQRIQEYTFYWAPLIKVLDLGNNRLEQLHVHNMFYSLGQLIYLSLENNNLRFVHPNALAPLFNLLVLDISKNPIREFDTKLTSAMKSIAEVRVNGTGIEVVMDF
ncbi:hypothetical protein ACOME3_006371 [Neoechinorhynchus agilis]